LIPREFQETLARERRDIRAAARSLESACAAGDVARFLAAVDLVNSTVDGWRPAVMRLARLPAVSAEIRAAWVHVWIESKRLPLHVGDRPLMARALRLLMPRDYQGVALQLYRGTSWQERRKRLYGFSWTRHREVARRFAEPYQQLFGGVILETVAPPDAVMLVREDDDEGEVVVDPFRLGKVMVIEQLPVKGAPTPGPPLRG
jgi:hypothetical protein